MIKLYIIPRLSVMKIDSEISLRLSSDPENLVYEPGSGGAGQGGQGNGSGETGWNRTSFSSSGFNDFSNNDIWSN